MSEEDKHFIKRYEELLDKGYCDCNEMNCLDNNPPKKILNIMKEQQQEIERLHSIIKEVREYIKEACWLDEVNKPNSLGHKQTMKVLEILDKGE